jgi:hypothetical protein
MSNKVGQFTSYLSRNLAGRYLFCVAENGRVTFEPRPRQDVGTTALSYQKATGHRCAKYAHSTPHSKTRLAVRAQARGCTGKETNKLFGRTQLTRCYNTSRVLKTHWVRIGLGKL